MAHPPPPPDEVNDGSDTSDDNIYLEWEPMQSDHFSLQNLISVDQDDPMGFNLGVKSQKITKLKDVPCQYYNGIDEYCWKGPLCGYKHEKGRVNKSMDFGKEKVASIMGMDSKPILHAEATITVSVIHVVSPSEFYVVALLNRRCQCEKAVGEKAMLGAARPADTYYTSDCGKEKLQSARQEHDQKDCNQGIQSFSQLQESLNESLSNGVWRFRQSASYVHGQLVAVMCNTMTWTRAEILETNVKNSTGRDLPWFKVRLIDVGIVKTVIASRICTLPPSLGFQHAMAFKCALDMTCVRSKWYRPAIEMFQSLISTPRDLQLTVKETPVLKNKSTINYKTIEPTPYIVELRVMGDGKGEQSINVSEYIAKRKKAILLCDFPFRPSLESKASPLISMRHAAEVSEQCKIKEKSRTKTILKLSKHELNLSDESDSSE